MSRSPLLALAFFALVAASSARKEGGSVDVLSCIADGPSGCVQDHLDKILSRANLIPQLRITRDLSIVTIPSQVAGEDEEDDGELGLWNKFEGYLYRHALRLEMPRELAESGVVPQAILNSLPRTITVPLAEAQNGGGRGFMKKVVLPFLLGLKFKATVVIPLAMALIALKTWKALTMGLLSMVLSAAMIIFKLSRPKVMNYEVYYPPPAATHHHIVDHTGPAAFAYEHHHRAARQLPHDLAYSAQKPSSR